MIDEYPQTICNIIEDQSEECAKHLLQTSRELRQNSELSGKIQFIYTGSINLTTIAKNLDATKFINDLNEVKVSALTTKEADKFVDELLENIEFDISSEVKKYLLNRVEWLIPFYIQVLISEIREIYYEEEIDNDQITDKHIIDKAFLRAIEKQQYYSSWRERLNVYRDNEYKFIMEVLNSISVQKKLDFSEIYNMSVKHEIEDKCKGIIQILKHDGYIQNNEDENIYMFNSPILREWWCKYSEK
jgi:hypothetical protein